MEFPWQSAPELLTAGQLVLAALAAGVNLYATILAIGIASLTGLAPALPAGL